MNSVQPGIQLRDSHQSRYLWRSRNQQSNAVQLEDRKSHDQRFRHYEIVTRQSIFINNRSCLGDICACATPSQQPPLFYSPSLGTGWVRVMNGTLRHNAATVPSSPSAILIVFPYTSILQKINPKLPEEVQKSPKRMSPFHNYPIP